MLRLHVQTEDCCIFQLFILQTYAKVGKVIFHFCETSVFSKHVPKSLLKWANPLIDWTSFTKYGPVGFIIIWAS